MASGGNNSGSGNNAGTSRPAKNNAFALGLDLMNFGGVVKVLGTLLAASTGVVGIGFLG